ncbi:transcriptional regulator [Burkholderiaceae bacterium UC74_6]
MAQAKFSFPVTQGELIKRVRADQTQVAFARTLEVSRSCLSRYESEQLGAPTEVINYCLRAIAAQLSGQSAEANPLERALQLSRDTTRHLEHAARRLRT